MITAFTLNSSRKSDTNNEMIELKEHCTDEISSADSKVIPTIGSPRSRYDFQLLESKIQRWKESQVGNNTNLIVQ